MRGIILAVLTLVVIIYLLLGGAVFFWLEGFHEHTMKMNTANLYENFKKSVNSCVTTHELEMFVQIILEASDSGVRIVGHGKDYIHWNFGNSVFFSMTAVTTIGYGNHVPVTQQGRLFLCIYAILGIPLAGLLIAGYGKNLGDLMQPLQSKILMKKNQKVDKILKSSLIISVCFVVFVLLPAILFSYLENWTYLESFYYCIVTLTTIGFGDYVTGIGKNRVGYRLASSLWIFFGLAWIAMILGNLQGVYKDFTAKVDTKIRWKYNTSDPSNTKTEENGNSVAENDNKEEKDEVC